MIEILMKLEPRKEEKDTIIFYELDDFCEILFFMRGAIDIGFELNRKRFFVLRKGAGVIIADHGCTFGHTSVFIYKTHSNCEGFSIRKLDWLSIMQKPELLPICEQIKQKIVQDHFFNIKIKMNRCKK